MPAAPRRWGGLGWRSLGVFCQGLLLVSACSKGHHLARSRGSRYSRGHEMGLKGIPGRRPPGGGSGGGRKCVMAVSLSLLCVSDRGEPGADRISPGRKEALEDVGPLGLEPREAPWLLQGGGDTWASAHGPLPWPHLRCHMGTGIGPRAGRVGGCRGATSLTRHCECLSLTCPGVAPGQAGGIQAPRCGWPRALGVTCFLFYSMSLTMVT